MYLNTKQMQQRYGVARETIRRWEQAGRLPPRINPSGKPKGRRYLTGRVLRMDLRSYLLHRLQLHPLIPNGRQAPQRLLLHQRQLRQAPLATPRSNLRKR